MILYILEQWYNSFDHGSTENFIGAFSTLDNAIAYLEKWMDTDEYERKKDSTIWKTKYPDQDSNGYQIREVTLDTGIYDL